MSDFLTRLAERALGQGTRVQPKLPRRFAAVRPVHDPARDWWQEELARHRSARKNDPGPLASAAGERDE